jgi:hypothetical protein
MSTLIDFVSSTGRVRWCTPCSWGDHSGVVQSLGVRCHASKQPEMSISSRFRLARHAVPTHARTLAVAEVCSVRVRDNVMRAWMLDCSQLHWLPLFVYVSHSCRTPIQAVGA